MTKPIEATEIASLLDEHAKSLSLFAANWSRSPEDCVQEAFVALASQIPPPANKVAWLFRVVKNHALNEQRTCWRRSEREKLADVQRTSANPSDRIEEAEQRDLLFETLEELETDDRELIVLRIWSGLTWVEIAELTGTSSSSAQRNYVAALEKLKRTLESKCLAKPN